MASLSRPCSRHPNDHCLLHSQASKAEAARGLWDIPWPGQQPACSLRATQLTAVSGGYWSQLGWYLFVRCHRQQNKGWNLVCFSFHFSYK